MTSTVKPIPDGFHTLTPHLVCRDAVAAIKHLAHDSRMKTKLSFKH